MNDVVTSRPGKRSPSAEPDLDAVEARPSVGVALRHARQHHELSLREVERRIGRSNAYLSQIERGLIKQPDPIVLLELSELYGLDFLTLANWAHWVGDDDVSDDSRVQASTTTLVRQIMELNGSERADVLRYVDTMLRKRRT